MTAHISEDGLNREETVAEHTEKTANLCREKGKKCNIPNIMYLCGILHDMGKNKQRFDAYIHADENTKRKLKGSIAHASTGQNIFMTNTITVQKIQIQNSLQNLLRMPLRRIMDYLIK